MRPDQLFEVEMLDVQRAAFSVLNALQGFKPQVLVAGIAWMFLAICDRYDVDPRNVLDVSDRVRRRAMDIQPVTPRAIMRYCREELPNG